MSYHDPVLLRESIEGLITTKDGIYVDATFGGGGHSKAILQKITANGHLYSFDQDEDAIRNIVAQENFTFLHYNFRFIRRALRLNGITHVDGILADLGVSSHQFDQPQRGFSHRFEAQLDMRMDQQTTLTAADILNTYEADQLQNLLGNYGEVRNARTLAKAIVDRRASKPIRTTGDLLAILDHTVRGNRQRYLAQVFQALRIEVNDEMGALKELLLDSLELLQPNGRLVVISYHSLEDRIVKNFLRTGNTEGKVEKDFFGNIHRPFKLIAKKAMIPAEEEQKINPRSKSARMRIGQLTGRQELK